MDFPTCVGMARVVNAAHHPLRRFPHLRGDGPEDLSATVVWVPISPPAWGWPVAVRDLPFDLLDFPTCVGMARVRGQSHTFTYQTTIQP